MDTFNQFDNGQLSLPDRCIKFADLQWNEHPVFKGVALKHIVTAADTDGRFSYHLVRIAPNCAIGQHVHATQLETHEVVEGSGVCTNNGKSIDYKPGTISVIPANVGHEVKAGASGLYLFAKFMPALC